MGSRGGGGGSNAGGVQQVPAASRKMVQSLKEIVNGVSEAEIYSMLKACNMDPNEAVNRLLSQDPFHEVKSKREKKKEFKDTTESRPHGGGSTSNRAARSGSNNYAARGGSAQINSSESGGLHGKPVHKRETGTSSFTGSSSRASGMAANNANHPTFSDSLGTENKANGILSFSQPSSGYQSAWLGVPGQKSMADIVKMGRPQSKAYNTSNPSQQSTSLTPPPFNGSHYELHSSEDYASKVSESLHVSPDDEWPSIEQPQSVDVHFGIGSLDSKLNSGQSSLRYERSNQHLGSQVDDSQAEDENACEDHVANEGQPASVSSSKVLEDTSQSAPLHDDDLSKHMDSYHSQDHAFEHKDIYEGDASITSVSANIQQLNIQEEKQTEQPEEDGPSLVIPDHLQVHIADCSHLSFGSFVANMNSEFSEPFASTSNIEEAPTEAETSSVGRSETINSEYFGNDSIRTSENSLVNRMGASAGTYDLPSASQAEVLKQETSEMANGNQFGFPPSSPGYTFDNGQLMDSSFAQSQAHSQMQNNAPFPNGMQAAYTNSLPSILLASNGHTIRESDLSYSQFLSSQSMPTKYGSSASSASSSTISVVEALKSGSFSSSQPTQQTLPGNSLPPHLSVNPYSQPNLPLGPYANMIGYPLLPQSYAYMPSGFQQAYAGNSSYHQQLAALLPHFKNNVSASSLPQSGGVASGYGSIAGNYQSAAPTGSTLTYDDVLNAHYKDNNQLLSLQQNENSAMWVHGAGSRTPPSVAANTYYNLQGQNQNQQPGAFMQGQAPSHGHGSAALNHPNFYHSQTGHPHEPLQLNPRDAFGSHPQPKPQLSQQIWQNSY